MDHLIYNQVQLCIAQKCLPGIENDDFDNLRGDNISGVSPNWGDGN